MPEGSSQYTYLQSKRWRALGYNWDILSSYGQASKLYCLTDFQVAWLLSNTEYMRWSSRWQNCPCTQADMDAMKAEMEYNLMNCLDIQPWQMDYIYDQMQAQNLAGLDALWDGVNPDSVNPNTPNDFYSGDDSDDRLDALCTACKIYVYSYAENWSNIASSVLQIANLVALATRLLPVGGIIAGVIVKGLAYLTEIALNAMQDESALDDIVCCMYNNLIGTALLSGNFETSLDGCSFTVGSNQAIARDIIGSDLDQFGNWLSFINQLGNSYVLAEVGVSDCPCGEPWSATFDFTIDDQSWEYVLGPPSSTPRAEYVSSTGWTSNSYNVGAVNTRKEIRIYYTSESRDADNLQLIIEATVTRTVGIFVYTCDGSGNPLNTVYSQEGHSLSVGENIINAELSDPTVGHNGYRVDIRALTDDLRMVTFSERYTLSGVT